jgi:cytochrome c-type biogenesis protein CcmF
MGDYRVVYRGDSASGINIYYNVDYFTLNEKGKMDKAFTLHPFIQTNPRMGNVAEPSTKHFLQKDIFTHVTYAKAETAEEKAKAENGWQEATDHTMKPGDTVFTSNSMVILQQIVKEPKIPGTQLQNGDIAVGAELKVMKLDGRTDVIMPAYLIRGMTTASIDTVLEASGLKFNFWKIDPESGVFHIKIAEKASNAGDFIILKAIIFPGINLLWTGCILMAIGTALAVWVRIRKRAKSSETD